ncbi:hypothetical protein AVEN_174426-1, partial [Araneus ventricosus]
DDSSSEGNNTNQENDEIDPSDFDKDEVESFDEKIEKTLCKFECVVEVFKKSRESKDDFLKSFDQWSEPCQKCVKDLRDIAGEIQNDKFGRDLTRGIGNAAAALGVVAGLACPPLAVAGGIACAVGNGVALGTTVLENLYANKKMEEAEALLREEKKRYSAMRWFSCPKKLQEALGSLVDLKVLEQMEKRVQTFSEEVRDKKDMTGDEFKNHYEQVLDSCMDLMAKDRKMIEEYGKELAPAVMTFVFVVCLMNDHNRIVLDCSLTTLRLTSVLNVGLLACGVAGALAIEGAIAEFISSELIVWLRVGINVLLAAKSFVDAYRQPDTELTEKIKEAADKIEGIYTYIEGVYKETKKYKSHDAVNQWKTVLVEHTPGDAESEDLKMAVKDYLPEEARGRIRTLRLPIEENNWLVMVPADHSQRLLEQTQINIKGKNCAVTL